METRNELSPALGGGMHSARSRPASPGVAGPLRPIRGGRRWSLIRFLRCEAGAVGVVLLGIVLDAALRPSGAVVLASQTGAFLAALLLSWRGLAGFVPDLDRRWRARRRMF